VKVKGPKGELFQAVDPDITVKLDNGVIDCRETNGAKTPQSIARHLPRIDKQHG
jgi:ribosomal protein L6P/L9E